MNFEIKISLLVFGLIIGMLICSEIGRRIGAWQTSKSISKTTGSVDAAVFGLLGLLVAFTFSGAASRFEERRQLITEEVNAIGTVYLRLDLLPENSQPEIKKLLKEYVDVRASVYAKNNSEDDIVVKLDDATKLQTVIWQKVVAATNNPDTKATSTSLLIPALNDMFDIATSRSAATLNHPPLVIYFMLASLAMVSALLIGYGSSDEKRSNWFIRMVFALTLSTTVYVIIDLEYPRLGFFRVDAADQLLVDLSHSIKF